MLVALNLLFAGGCATSEVPPKKKLISTGEVRFIALGDGGEGNDSQHENAVAVAEICEELGCDFALYLGDNIYDVGVDSVDDEQFETKFEIPYAGLDFPFWVVMGNHDYGGSGLGTEFHKVQYEIDYSDHSEKWTMPAAYYSFVDQHAQFFGLDTNAIMWDEGTAEQQAWLQGEVDASESFWRIGYGHHPYISNGRHGNAGTYEGIEGVPILSGDTVKDFMDDGVCGQMQLYLAGHDHTLQWLEPQCGTEFIVSGAAAKTTDLEGRGTPTFFETDASEGFVWISLIDKVMSAKFYDKSAALLFEQTVDFSE